MSFEFFVKQKQMQSVVIEQTRACLSFDSDKYRELMDGRKVEFHFHSNIK